MQKWLVGVLGLIFLLLASRGVAVAKYEYDHALQDLLYEKSFYDCCGISRTDALRLHRLVNSREDLPKPSSIAALTSAQQLELVQGWLRALRMADASEHNREINMLFRSFGKQAKALLRTGKVTEKAVAQLSADLIAQSENPVPARLNVEQQRQLSVLLAKEPYLVVLAKETLTRFETIASRSDIDASHTALLTHIYARHKYPTGMVAFCLVTPWRFDGTDTITTRDCFREM